MKKSRLFFLVPYVLWLGLFVIAPIILITINAFKGDDGFTLKNFQQFFVNGTFLRMTLNSFWYAFLITLITLLISYPIAYILSQMKNQQFWLLLIILPTWINLLLKAYAFIGIFGKHGLLNNFLKLFGIAPANILFTDFAFIFVAAYIEIPFMILPIYNAICDINPAVIQAAYDLGASKWQTFMKVLWPLSKSGVESGIQAVFIPSLSLFMLTRLIGGNRVITLGTAIEVMYLPIFYLIYYSFSSGHNMDHFEKFTLSHYQDLFNDNRLLAIFLGTILLALLSSLIATVIGTFGAIAISQTKNKKGQKTLLALNNVLMVSPDVIIGASFLIFFTFLGIGLGFGSVLLSHIAFSIPIVVLMVLPRLKEFDYSLVDAARDLGASTWQVYSKVMIPAITPGILAGFFMALTYSLDDFAVTFFVTGNGFSTLSVEIYSRARQGINLEINALSTLMFIFVMVLVLIYYVITNHKSHIGKGRAQ